MSPVSKSGLHTDSAWLREDVELNIYFASLQHGKEGKSGAVWVYEDSHVVVVRGNPAVPTLRGFKELP